MATCCLRPYFCRMKVRRSRVHTEDINLRLAESNGPVSAFIAGDFPSVVVPLISASVLDR